ncbi:MAG TPA: shikimate dehydrogenase [Gemmatimonadaceae bacterium]|nr:shikimate dehydrogenase [Gemmatimonadaceae bacterium]
MIQRDRVVLLGHPVSHSLSPVMQNAALEAAGLELRYEAVDVMPESLGDLMTSLAEIPSAGNVTLPHKVAAFGLMSHRSDVAARVGAINTFWRQNDGGLYGDNTDVGGFLSFAEESLGVAPANPRIAVIGAGGAAAAVLAAASSWQGSTVRVHARNLHRARNLCARFSDVATVAPMAEEAVAYADIIVNATPIGMTDDRHPVPLELLDRGARVLDLVYRPGETSWVRAAREKGHNAHDGLRMLLHQGAASFRRWFDIEPNTSAMWDALLRACGRS